MNPFRRPLSFVVSAALVVGLLVFPVAALQGLRAEAAGPVSGAIGLGGGLSGSVDERTGLFSVSVPVVSVAGPGSAGVTWSLVWDQGRAVDGVDRSGFGAGWSLGVSFINPATPETVYPANGGSYSAGGTYLSGLVNYPLQDLEFRRDSGGFAFELLYDDGRVDSFDVNGNLVARTDRFGNRTQFGWEVTPGIEGGWRPTSIVDGYGLETRFTYSTDPISGDPLVEVAAPARSDGVVATTRITLDDQRRVRSVTDPSGATAEFEYTPEGGLDDIELLTTVISASQAHTRVFYQDFAGQPGLTAVQAVVTTDAEGLVVGPARLFSMNPPDNVDGHNYTGNPDHLSGTTDGLFASGDGDYFYTTAISSCVVTELPPPESCPGSPLSTVSTYDSQHRLVERKVMAGQVTVQHQTSTYVAVSRLELDPNYARPLGTSVTYQATSSPDGITAASGSRTVESGRVYDSHGRVTSSTDETGTTTTVTYDEAFGLITNVTVMGADGSRSVTSHTLSDDRKSIVGASTSYAAPGQPLSARSTTSYAYDTTGQLLRRTMTWAPGAQPDPGGPSTVITKFDSAVDAAARTRTITTTTAVGTSAEAASVTVLDLVTGQAVRNTDPLGRVTTYTYDTAGRQASRTTPDGLTSTTTYTAATSSTPATRTDTTADGRVVLTTYDVLGRKVRVTDNVKDQAFTASPTSRQLSAFEYNLAGTTITATDQHGRTVHTTLDALGRQVAQIAATGIAHTSTYDDAAHTTTQTIVPDGSDSAEALRTATYDNANRAVTIEHDYSDGTADPVQTAAFDGLGRMVSQQSDDLELEYSYLGAGGASTTQTATPHNPAYPGETLDLSRSIALGGQQTSSQRQQAGATADGTGLTYDPAGRIATSTDPNGRVTGYTYYADGNVATRTTPSGTVVTDTYDDTTGRLLNVTAQPPTGPSVTLSYTYVPAGQPGAGLVHTVSDGTDTVTLGYDADRHVVSRAYSDGTATSATFTDTGLLGSTTDVTGAITSYGYDTLGRMTSATQTRHATTVLASVGYTYDGMSRILTTTRGNGVTTTNTWTPRNQLATQTTTNSSGVVIEEHAYTYDSHGNVARRTDTLPAVANSPTAAGTWTTAYRYDGYDRLIGSATFPGTTATGPASTSIDYTLNTAGDVVGVTTGSSSTINTIDAAGQLTAQTTDGTVVAQSFDGDGRVTHSLSGSAITYDGFDRMLTATRGATTAAYTYWPDGTRRAITTTSPAPAVCEQAIAEAGTGEGTYGRYQLVQAPAVGRSGSQVVVGTPGPDRLVGGSGNDVVCGLGGDDVLLGDSGHDHLDGGDGSDELQGGSGNDHLDGAAGFDRLFGSSGNDTLTNGELNDGGSGQNHIGPPPPVTATSSQTFHYGPDGTLVNDTTADTTTATTATTASYLITAGREARTLQPGTTGVGAVPARAPAPVTVGTGTGYLLRDRHSSVTALVDADAAVTNTYNYSDYGSPALPDGRLQAAPAPTPGGLANPFQYTGATPISSMIDPTTGLLLLPARSYDPGQGRFTTRDTANVFNKYQAFSTNPIINVDPTGHISLEDLLIDIGTLLVFAVATIATAGAAFVGAAAIVGAEVGVATTSTIVSFAATAVTAYASATGAVATAIKVADDVDDAVTGKHFLTNNQRTALGTVQMVAGAVAAVSGLASVGAASAGAIAEAGPDLIGDVVNAKDAVDPDPFGNNDLGPYNPDAQVWGGDNNIGDADATNSDAPPDRGPGSRSRAGVPRGVASRADIPRPLDVFGSVEVSDTDESILDESPDVKASINANERAATRAGSRIAETMQSTPTSPRLTAMSGNFSEEDDVFDAEPDTSDTSDPLSTIDADVALPIDRFAPYRFSFE